MKKTTPANESTSMKPHWKDRVKNWFNPYDPSKLTASELKPVAVEESKIKKSIFLTMLGMTTAFVVWASTAPLDAGIHITGKVSVSGKKKEVAHPNGGVVQEILVKEGDRVEKGQTLIKVNPLNTEAKLNDAQLQYINMLAIESRLMAERDDEKEIRWMGELNKVSKEDDRVAQVLASQNRVFISGRSERLQQRSIINQQMQNLRNRLSELEHVLRLKKQQATSLGEEAANSRTLADKGYVPKNAANEAERERSNLLASLSSTVSDISATQADLSARRLELVQLEATFQKEVNEKLTEVQRERKTLSSQVESLKFDADLADVKAPEAGTVVGLKANTVGGVIRAADVLMEIVPSNTKLIIEGKVPPMLIDKIRVGMETDMRFTAFNLHTTPVIGGTVTLVGADLLPAQKEREEYYLTLVETSLEGVQALGDLEIQPGMPVDLIVKNGERTFMSYLIKPLTDGFAIAFKD